MTEAPFMFDTHAQELAQLYLNYEEAAKAQSYDHEACKVAYEAWKEMLFRPPFGVQERAA